MENQSSLLPLAGKTAIVTGAGSGINLAFTKLLLSKGCNVLLADLSLRPEAQEVISSYSATATATVTPSTATARARAIFQKTDVTSWTELERMFTVAETEFGNGRRGGGGGIDIVCPGAGVYDPPWSNFWNPPGDGGGGGGGNSSSKDPIDGNGYKVIDINLVHPIRCTQLAISRFLAGADDYRSDGDDGNTNGNGNMNDAAADHPRENRDVGGSGPGPGPGQEGNKMHRNRHRHTNRNRNSARKTIVHISSIAGQAHPLPTPLYNATKHGINGFVRSLGPLEDRIGIRVAAVAPGVIRTPLWTDHPEKLRAVDEGKDEWVTAEDVAEIMCALVERDEVPVDFTASAGSRIGSGSGTPSLPVSSGGSGGGNDVDAKVAGEVEGGGGGGGGKTKEVEVEETIKIRGGSIVEVSKGRVRDVKAVMDPGPFGRPGNTVGGMGKLEEEVWECLSMEGWGVV